MRRATLFALLACLAAPAALAGPPLGDAQLLRILPRASMVRGGFDSVEEQPVDPSRDPDLREWGVKRQRARHYTRDGRAGIQVCSVEVWAFRDEAHALAALAGFRFAEWQFAQRGSVLLMARGITRPRGARPHRGVFPECEAILSQAIERAPRSPSS